MKLTKRITEASIVPEEADDLTFDNRATTKAGLLMQKRHTTDDRPTRQAEPPDSRWQEKEGLKRGTD